VPCKSCRDSHKLRQRPPVLRMRSVSACADMGGVMMQYAEMLEKLPRGRKHIVLGNGFSIGCDERFSYPNLFDYACKNGLSERAQGLFQRVGTNNFEGVLRMLEDSIWTIKHYGFEDKKRLAQMEEDIETVKNTLVRAIAETHLEHTGEVADDKKACCVQFLSQYHNVFTTNYDLLLYWVAMAGPAQVREQDGFRLPVEEEDPKYLVFTEHTGSNRGMLFLHGALHFYVVDGEVRKHCWERTGERLTTLIRDGLQHGQYPLFVAEGKPERKREQIQRSGYLSFCLGKLERIENTLVIYGHSLNETDQHILNTIVDNPGIERVCIGIHADPESQRAAAIRKSSDNLVRRRKEWRRKKPKQYGDLEVIFYDSKTVPVWAK
jgi:hypothetical protein